VKKCRQAEAALYTVSVQTWDGLRSGLLAVGYRLVGFWQFACAARGHFRVATELESDFFPCPTCQKPCKAVFLAHGYTHRELPFIEQTMKPLQLK
jgi:hypothetical protein